MTFRTIIVVIILLLVLGLFSLWQWRPATDKQQALASVTAFNESKNQDAQTNPVGPGDLVVYTFSVENPNKNVMAGYVVEANISDVQELADLYDAEGANYNPATSSLIWTPLDIPKKSSITKKVRVKVKDNLPLSSDFVMRLKFGNDIAVVVSRPTVVGNTQTIPSAQPSAKTRAYKSPTAGPSGFLSLFAAVLATVIVSIYRRRLA